jgi:hypothetical protein
MRIGLRQLSGQVVMAFTLSSWVHGGEIVANKTETLARHETVAEFRGTNYHRCMGMTSLCPDKCGQSGTLATFKIVNYVKYEKLGEYGDPKCEEFACLVEDSLKQSKVPADIRAAVNALKPGDVVLLAWNHDYVTRNGASAPERPLTRLEKLADLGTKEWMLQIDRRAGVRDSAGHAPEIGSAEWMQAVSVKLGVFDTQGHGPTPDTAEWRNAIQWKAFGIRPGSVKAGSENNGTGQDKSSVRMSPSR